ARRQPVRGPARRRAGRAPAVRRLRGRGAGAGHSGRRRAGPRRPLTGADVRSRHPARPGADREDHRRACGGGHSHRAAADRGGHRPLLRPARGGGVVSALTRPYLAALAARFQLTLQYRAAALAGFATQLWWGGLKVMIYVAFFASAPAAAARSPIGLADTITYTWIAQAFLVLQPWTADPEVSQAVRSGAVAYDRLRPVDTYGFWYARTLAWSLARVAPRAVLMAATAA